MISLMLALQYHNGGCRLAMFIFAVWLLLYHRVFRTLPRVGSTSRYSNRCLLELMWGWLWNCHVAWRWLIWESHMSRCSLMHRLHSTWGKLLFNWDCFLRRIVRSSGRLLVRWKTSYWTMRSYSLSSLVFTTLYH